MTNPERPQTSSDSLARYHRQMLLPEVGGKPGQDRLLQSHALVVGCGALGSMAAQMLCRAGVGTLTIVDRDLVEVTNLQRQVLFDERDATEGAPKAEAAKRRLGEINSSVRINAVVDDVNPASVQGIIDQFGPFGVIVDGLDNFETRYLLNDISVRDGIGYVYGGAVATSGMTATFLPHRGPWGHTPQTEGRMRSSGWDESDATPCLRCLFEEAPPAGTSPTCDTVGVLGSIVTVIASIEAAEAMKILLGDYRSINRNLTTIDLWHHAIHQMGISTAFRKDDCPCCQQRKFEYADGERSGFLTSLCGRDAIQIVPASASGAAVIDMSALAEALRKHGRVVQTPFLLRAEIAESFGKVELTVFPNGRAIIRGTDRPEQARSVYARFVGS